MKRTITILMYIVLLAASAYGGVSGRVSGQGFYAAVMAGDDTFSVREADLFVDGDVAFFVLRYSSQREYRASFFDPPNKRVANMTVDACVREGDGLVVFTVPLGALSSARGFTVLIAPPSTGRFIYFAITGGPAGLARKSVTEDIRDAAIAALPAE